MPHIHFPKIFTIFLVFFFFPHAPAYAVNVGKPVVGKEYNDIIGRWIDRRIGIVINTDHSVMIAADTSLGQANVFLPSSKSVMKELESSVLKAIKWSQIAKKHKAEIRKRIGCLKKTREFSKSCHWHEYVDHDEY